MKVYVVFQHPCPYINTTPKIHGVYSNAKAANKKKIRVEVDQRLEPGEVSVLTFKVKGAYDEHLYEFLGFSTVKVPL